MAEFANAAQAINFDKTKGRSLEFNWERAIVSLNDFH